MEGMRGTGHLILPGCPEPPGRLFDGCSSGLQVVAEDPGRYIHRDPALVPLLKQLRNSGRKASSPFVHSAGPIAD